ncbi:hypothetical protein BU17DRAFT_70867 [Hysterangium stoloniferum]|nr:hypothetical protein BU17DRAFT_70867 [Hysterangium stoloniferum]
MPGNKLPVDYWITEREGADGWRWGWAELMSICGTVVTPPGSNPVLGWFENWYTTSTSGIKIGVLESHFQNILQRQVACNREDHGVCYYRPGRDEHVPIDKKALHSWVQQLCRAFATGLEPPQGLLDSSGIEQGMSDIERETP